MQIKSDNFSYLSFGANIGDIAANFTECLTIISQSGFCNIDSVSPLYLTSPWGYRKQPDFLNFCIKLNTTLKPAELLKYCQELEDKFGRKRELKWGERTLDIDILLYQNMEQYKDKNLVLPHKYLHLRAFVLIPLQKIAPRILIKGKDINYYLSKLPKNEIQEIVYYGYFNSNYKIIIV